MKNLIKNVSHSSRCAPLSTVNLAMNPRIPVDGATISSAGTIVLVWSLTMSILRLHHKTDARQSQAACARKRECSTKHVGLLIEQFWFARLTRDSISFLQIGRAHV